jgi:hypothetical protein
MMIGEELDVAWYIRHQLYSRIHSQLVLCKGAIRVRPDDVDASKIANDPVHSD